MIIEGALELAIPALIASQGPFKEFLTNIIFFEFM
jgi:hypothetical protein